MNYQTDFMRGFFASNAQARLMMQDHYDCIADFDAEYQTDSAAVDFMADRAEEVARYLLINGNETDIGRAILTRFLDSVRWFEVGQELYIDFGHGMQWEAR